MLQKATEIYLLLSFPATGCILIQINNEHYGAWEPRKMFQMVSLQVCYITKCAKGSEEMLEKAMRTSVLRLPLC